MTNFSAKPHSYDSFHYMLKKEAKLHTSMHDAKQEKKELATHKDPTANLPNIHIQIISMFSIAGYLTRFIRLL